MTPLTGRMSDGDPSPRRLALLVATSTYDDPGLARLVSPAQDVEALGTVLGARGVGDFDVSTVVDAPAAEICQVIDDFTAERERADLVVLYLSCHGLKDEQGRLYFAARNTRRDRLRSTAVSAGFVNDVLFACRSRRKVLLLDCCYSGAFARGLAVKADPSVHTPDHFDARGLVVLTASDATQYAFEGDTLTGGATPSVFTASVADGLRTGAADVDGDGFISVDDVYEFTRRRLAAQPRPQSPRKWEFDVAGTIVLARSPTPPDRSSATVPEAADLPAVLPTPAAEEPVHRLHVQQAVWWLGALLFFVTATGSSALVAYALANVLHTVVPVWEYFMGPEDFLVAGGSGGAAWALAYAVVDANASSTARWYTLHVHWIVTLVDLFHPTGARHLLRAARAAVPLNVALTLLASAAAAVLAYVVSGSNARDTSFRLVFTLLVTLTVVPHVVRGSPTPA